MSEVSEIRSLTESANSLRDEVSELRRALGPRVRRAEMISLMCLVAVVAGLAMFAVYRQLDADRRIAATQAQLAGLCPVLALVLGGADPNSREVGLDRDRYVESIRVMTQAYGQLGCDDPLVPGRQLRPTQEAVPPTTGG